MGTYNPIGVVFLFCRTFSPPAMLGLGYRVYRFISSSSFRLILQHLGPGTPRSLEICHKGLGRSPTQSWVLQGTTVGMFQGDSKEPFRVHTEYTHGFNLRSTASPWCFLRTAGCGM